MSRCLCCGYGSLALCKVSNRWILFSRREAFVQAIVKALLIGVELSDKTGMSATRLVGVFDNDVALDAAKIAADRHYAEHRCFFTVVDCQLNEPLSLPSWRHLR